MSSPAAAASCVDCGGAVEVTLAGAPIQCGYCGSEAPLPPALSERVAALRDRLAQQARRERQLVGAQAELGQTYGYFFLVAILSVWVVLAGCIALWPLLEPAPGMTAWEYMTIEYRGTERLDDHVMKWWASYAVVLGFWLTVTLYLATLVSLRRITRWTFPQPPVAPGRPPRCRCCGAELGTEGVIRRCGHCDADHVVQGERYQVRQSQLEDALRRCEAQLEETLEARNQRIERLFGVAGTLPIVVALFAPLLGFVFTRTDPRMWSVPIALVVISALLVVWCERWRPPEIPSFSSLQAGAEVYLRGEKLRVLGILSLRKGLAALHLVGSGDEPTAAFMVRDGKDGAPVATGFVVAAGGEALTEEDLAKGFGFELRRDRGLGALAGRSAVWGRLGPTVSRAPEYARLVLGEPEPGSPPTYTVTRRGILSEAELSLFEVGPRT